MKSLRPGFVVVTLLAAWCGGCTSSSPNEAPGSFAVEPLMTMTSATGALRVAVRSAPTQPPEIGDSTWSYTIANAETGKPASGLSLDVVPWMPAMGHGTSTVPSVTEMGDGVYVVADVELFMPGQWDLRTSISGSDKDSVVVSVDIP